MKIVFLPVDERFCTRDYFLMIGKAFNIEIKTPPRELLGCKKVPANIQAIHEWLQANIREDDIAILSLDMFLHGGLIQSRTSIDDTETLLNRLESIK